MNLTVAQRQTCGADMDELKRSAGEKKGKLVPSAEPIFVPRVISCLAGVSCRGPSLVYCYSFLFLHFLTGSLSPVGRGR